VCPIYWVPNHAVYRMEGPYYIDVIVEHYRYDYVVVEMM
jgi:hypothetical protein